MQRMVVEFNFLDHKFYASIGALSWEPKYPPRKRQIIATISRWIS